MAKRFTCTEKWKKVWFRKLSPLHKALWEYLRDNCNHAGVWEIDFDLASVFIGQTINSKEAEEVFKKQYILSKDQKKWILIDFIDFQYGELNPENRAHLSVINILKKEGAYKGLTRGLLARKDKVKDKDKDKDKSDDEDFISSLKTNPAYKGIDIDCELGKMDAWLSTHPGRKKTRRFIVNWLNKIDKPIGIKPKDKEKPNPKCNVCKGTGKADKGAKCFCWDIR